MRPGPRAAAQHIEQIVDLQAEPADAVDILARLCVALGWYGEYTTALEKAESWRGSFLNELSRRRALLVEKGQLCPYDFNSSSEYMIQGAAFPEPGDSEQTKAAKESLLLAETAYRDMASLSPEGFESACAKALRTMGVANPTVTRRADDGGVDFYGKVQVGLALSTTPQTVNPLSGLGLWIVGQAKHYPKGRVQTEDVRELVGAATLAAANATGRAAGEFTDLQIRPFDALCLMMVTSGSFTDSAMHIMEQSGVVGIDGMTLAAVLAQLPDSG